MFFLAQWYDKYKSCTVDIEGSVSAGSYKCGMRVILGFFENLSFKGTKSTKRTSIHKIPADIPISIVDVQKYTHS